jgi:hypothetical protein
VLATAILEPGQRVTVWTAAAPASLDFQLGNGLVAAKLTVRP